jgi:hypothetical protein
MSGPFFFAWVNAADSTWSSAFAREDEDVFDLKVSHSEGEYPTATVLIRNPNVGLLAPSRKQWAWVSYAGGDTAGPVPVFFGRIAGNAVSMADDVIQLALRARPKDVQEQKEALAETLRVTPYWDPVWIRPERRLDPEQVLESRTQLWHFSRLGGAVTVSDILDGEDGTETFTEDDYFEGSISVSLGEQPLRNVSVEADVAWVQKAVGYVNLSQAIIDAFHDAGSQREGLISSFTGQGLMSDWPQKDDDIGAGWFVYDTSLTREDGISVPLEYSKTKCKYKEEPDSGEKDPPSKFKLRMALWQIRPTFYAGYDVERRRIERVKFTISADVQPLWTDAEDQESELLKFSSNDIAELIDDADTTSAMAPIRDVRRAQYFTTDRGQQSIKYLLMVARAHLLSRARAVTISIDIPFERALDLSCRKSATIVSPTLPGGVAVGKIVGYSFGVDENGESFGTVTIACSVGRGNSVAGAAGESEYDDDYAESDYGEITGLVDEVTAGELTYVPPDDPPNDDGVDFFDMRAANNVLTCAVIQGGEAEQREILKLKYRLVSDAVEALNNKHTILDIIMRPLVGDFDQTYNITVSQLMIPKTFDLEAT